MRARDGGVENESEGWGEWRMRARDRGVETVGGDGSETKEGEIKIDDQYWCQPHPGLQRAATILCNMTVTFQVDSDSRNAQNPSNVSTFLH